MSEHAPDPSPAAHRVPLREAVKVWALIGAQSFGGPAGQIAVMHRVLVEERRWVSERRFLHALNYCMLLPGPEAMQLATYVGWLMHRTLGGLIAGSLFVLPGFVSILVLSILYAGFRDLSIVEGVFFGIKPAVLAIVVHAVIRIGGRALRNGAMVAIAAAAFLSIFVFNVPFPAIVLGAAIIGLLGHRVAPARFAAPQIDDADDDSLLGDTMPPHAQPSWRNAIATAALWLAIWLLPVAALALALGTDHVQVKLAGFFSFAAAVTFGGAYAVLAFVAQQAVEAYGWLKPGEMLDGLGMAETTPGPLIQVVQFVGFMGAHRDAAAGGGSSLNPFVAGTIASVIVTWVTFVPCFLWIFVGGPFIESVRRSRRISAALSAITAAVVGVILNLACWFAVHTLFGDVDDFTRFGMRVPIPDPMSIDLAATAIAAVAATMIFVLKRGMLTTIATCAALGVVWTLVVVV